MSIVVAGLLLSSGLQPQPQTLSQPLPGARPCQSRELAELTADTGTPYHLKCRAVLSVGQAILRPVIIEGAQASGAGLDCAGGSLGRPGAAVSTQSPSLAIWSQRITVEHWSRPTDVRIAHCLIHGSVRIWGMGADGGYDDLRASSRTAEHTIAAQAAAPRRITLDQVVIRGTGSIPLYVGPGVTSMRLTRSTLEGRSVSTALYLDAESADNRVEGNLLRTRTRREMVAIDGSARNHIIGNRFELNGRPGILLYRNCGERAVIRHQTPSHNLITDNQFSGANPLRPRLVVENARQGRRSYCDDDIGYPWGSSANNKDEVSSNAVRILS